MPGLHFREWEPGDTPALARFMVLPAYNRWLANAVVGLADVDAMLKRHVARLRSGDRRHFRLCAQDVSTHELVGDGFVFMRGGGAAEVGWGVDPAVWNCGVGTMMGEIVCGMAVEQLGAEEVWCKVMSPNLASAHIAAKLGFELSKTVTSSVGASGDVVDVHYFKLTAQNYFERGYDV